jgi:hypothetical protein
MARKWTDEQRRAQSERMKAKAAKKNKTGHHGGSEQFTFVKHMARDVFTAIHDDTITLNTLTRRDALALLLYVAQRGG